MSPLHSKPVNRPHIRGFLLVNMGGLGISRASSCYTERRNTERKERELEIMARAVAEGVEPISRATENVFSFLFLFHFLKSLNCSQILSPYLWGYIGLSMA